MKAALSEGRKGVVFDRNSRDLCLSLMLLDGYWPMGKGHIDHVAKVIYSGIAMQRRADGDLFPRLNVSFNSKA